MSPPRIITIALVASLGIHIALALWLPGLRIRLPVSSERLVEVEVTQPEEPPAPAEEVAAAPEPEPALPPEPEPPPQKLPEAAPAPAPLAAKQVDVLDRMLVPPPSAPPATDLPRVQLPRREAVRDEEDTLDWSPPPPVVRSLPAAPTPAPSLELPPGPERRAGEDLAQSLLRQLQQAAPEPGVQAVESLRPLEIEGPVGQEREMLEQPPFPRVQIRHSADVRIKFYVSPRGEVVRALPVERGGDDLDRAALEYVKQIVFNPLPQGDEREQWGTIRVRFRLE